MRVSVSSLLPLALTGLATSAGAADLNLKIDIPHLTVAEYHKPYVAVWVEGADPAATTTLAVLYDLKKRDNAGEKWLKDLRQWWRKSGRDMHLPVDGVSGATRPAGETQLSFSSANGALAKLPPGDYTLMVEAAREAGTREVVKLPFQWPPKSAQNVAAKGEMELGAVALDVKP